MSQTILCDSLNFIWLTVLFISFKIIKEEISMNKIIMAVDFGDTRTGLALCDKAGMLAFGAGCIKCNNFKKTAEMVAEAAIQKKAELIVVGNPKNMDGSEGSRSQKCADFASYLHEISGITVELYDERLTTVSAHRFLSDTNVRGKKRKNTVDELSATIILEDFIARNRERL